MNKDNLEKVASHDGEALRDKPSIGYAINLIMDYGSGRQVTISGTLPLGATLQEMNAELDKLRLATNRQSSLVNKRDIENTIAVAEKTIAGLELMITEFTKGVEEELKTMREGETSKHTVTKNLIQSMRQQVEVNKRNKQQEILQARNDIEKGRTVLARIDKEINGG